MFLKLIIIALFDLIAARNIHVLMTEVFEIVVDPSMFNWTHEGIKDQYVYQASLLNAPDLPSWMNFVYSKKNHTGILYGVPPNMPNTKIPLEIIALNKKNYETRIETLNVIILNKRKPARYEVNIKIDNLNVEDMFNVNRTDALKGIFREKLWKGSGGDLYITFLSSAVELGARKPLVPGKEEGVVVRLGSYEEFSPELLKLQEEVRPLWKLGSCNFKRTSVQIIFRDNGFNLDWCFFRLMYNNNSDLNQPGANEKLSSLEENNLLHDHWKPVSKSDLPKRSYSQELLVSILVPLLIMLVLASTLSFILCLHHDDLKSPDDVPSEETNQFTTIQRATESIRSFSKNRDLSMSPDPMLLSRSQTNSPTSTISRGVHCRPSPPPYVRPKFKPEL
ncbi:epsilon-sarcoglycan isoform X2 [Anoplophora glabripennis]|uniref:epsilon-sarcoglycan isoform X2 n=1 Tax=Anoplophora glabripennis TaxID=217634 RepID=UPI000874C84C|nr:epsilon-sarcoglycan isoform X2 [Anoplophora glabripennis]